MQPIARGTALFALVVACGSHSTSGADVALDGGAGGHTGTRDIPAPVPASDASSAPTEQNADSYDDKDPTALQDFHPALDAHGTWADDPTYGTVWTPSATETGPEFVPYVSGGHWVYGDDYLWTSDYEWGWAPFHYGRWVNLEARGWSWIPGREYAPAWVEWRTGDAYLGWSPAPPLFIWRGGVAVTVGFAPPQPRFVFCAHADLFAPQPGRVVLMGPRPVEIESRTRVYGVPGGPGHFRPGPPLGSLHIPPERIVRATGHESGCARAVAFSRPSTALRLGAHPPVIRREPGGEAPREPVLRQDVAHGEGHQDAPHANVHAQPHGPAEHNSAPPGSHGAPPHIATPRAEPPKRRK
jgi:uncharacterized protein DUF6600